MIRRKVKALVDEALAGDVNFSEFDQLYRRDVNEGNFHDAILRSFLVYLQCQLKKSTESAQALKLLKTTIGFVIKDEKPVGGAVKITSIPGVNKDCRCTFCGKNNTEVGNLIAGPSVFICSECVVICNKLLKKNGPRAERNSEASEASKRRKITSEKIHLPRERENKSTKNKVKKALKKRQTK